MSGLIIINYQKYVNKYNPTITIKKEKDFEMMPAALTLL